MPPTLHIVAQNVSGYCLLDRTCIPCSGLSGKAFSVNFNLSHRSKPGTLAYPPKGLSFVCRASPNGKRRAKKKQNEEGDGYDHNKELNSLESEPILSISNNPSLQTTATPGPKEKEIADLFRKVQLQLKERAAKRKEERKVLQVEEEPPQQPMEESKSGDSISSLLELLRKHSMESDNNGGSNVTGKAQNGAVSNGIASSLYNNRKNWDNKPPSKGVSKFTRKSPIPRENRDKPMWSSSGMKKKFQEDIEEESEMESDDEFSSVKSGGALKETKKKNLPEVGEYPELDLDLDSESDSETEFDLLLEPEPEIDEAEAVFSEEADDEAPEDGNEEEEEEEVDLNSMKVVELRELAKTRGFTKYSKLKKVELIELLSRSSV